MSSLVLRGVRWRRASRHHQAVLVAVAAMIAAMLVILPFTSAHAAGTLLSQGQPTTASSIEGASTPASGATDGSTTTRWGSVFADPQWLEVDLGATDTITQVVLNWESAYATAYQIQTSTDNANWTSIYSTTTSTGGIQTLNISGSGRYVRMYGTVRNGGYGYSLWEFQVYGNTGTPPTSPPPTTPTSGCGTTNVALNKTATASSTENAGTESAVAAVDGNTNTRWSSLGTDPQWIEIDLGSTQSICAVTLNWETAYGKAFQIQTSTDNANWSNIYTTTTGTGGIQNLTGLSGSGHYIRMYGTVRGTQYGYSLWEFSVFVGGSPTSPPPSSPPPSSPPPSSPPPGNWTTVWSDDFTGTANTGVNTGNWKYDTGTAYTGGPANWGTGEVETMTNSTNNVALDGGGHLKITAVNSGGAWTSGRIETQRSDFAAPAGGQLRISAVIQQPNPANAIGYAPAFVAMGAGYRTNLASWPGSGEMDIMQDVNGKSQVSSNLQCGTAPDGPCTEYNGRNSALLTCQTCQTAYHTYSEIIDRSTTDESIKFFLDNDQIWVVRESDVGQAAWTAAVDHGFFLMLNVGVGTAFANAVCGCTSPTAATSSGGTMLVDSVTVQTQNIGVPAQYTTPGTPTGGTVVKVTGTKGNWGLTLNGVAYTIKGMTYGPPAAAAAGYMATLKKMGVNTIRTWGTDGTTQPLLDTAAAWGIHVVNGFWLNQGADYVNDTAYKTSTLNSIVATVNQYKNNPGVLMWDVGNEVILTTQDHYTGAQIEAERIAYAQYVNQVVDAIHAADPNHPVTSTDAYTGAWPYYKQYTPDLDLMAVNSYGAGCSVPAAFASGGYNKPYILTEGGASGEWEVPNDANGVPTEPTDQQKRDAYPAEWNCLTADHGDFLGGTFFHFGTENDFGGVWLNTYGGAWKRLSFYSVAGMYGGSPGTNTPPVITSMTAGQNVPAGGTFPVSVAVSDPNGDPIHYNLMYSNKYVSGGGTGFSWATFTQTGNGTFTVTAPASMGVWKVYVYAYDGQGNVGIETRSFNVVAPTVNGTNVSKGKPTTASTFQAADSATYTPGNATDGNFGTRWASAWADPQWIQVDLGAVTAIHHVQLAWESAYGKAYQIQTSNDGTNWTTVYSTTTGDGGFDDIDLNVSGRYVRMNGTARATTFGYSLFEFGVYS
jgi:hypothetical protein